MDSGNQQHRQQNYKVITTENPLNFVIIKNNVDVPKLE